MKIIITLLVSSCILSQVSAQPAAINSIFLKTKINPAVGNKIILTNEVREILVPYFPGVSINNINQALLDANPILNGKFVDLAAGALDNSKFSAIVSSIGDLTITNFADGLAKFLVERSKEELNVAFFRKLQEFLKKYPEIKIVFPSTVKIIENIASYQYAAMLPSLRASFQTDFNAFSSNLIGLRDTSSYENYATDAAIKSRADIICNFLNQTLGGRSIIASLIVTNGVVKGNNIADIITNVANDKLCTSYPNDNFSNSIKFIDLLSQSLKSGDEGRVWITGQQLSDLTGNNETMQIYLGLLYASDQKNSQHVHFTSGATSVTLQNALVAINTGIAGAAGIKFKETFSATGRAAIEVSDNAKNIINTKKQGDQSSILLYADYATSISTFLKLSIKLLSENSNLNPALTNLSADVLKFTEIINDAVACCYDIKSQSYGSLVLHTASLLSEITSANFNQYKNDYIKYGTFMANIVEAKNSDEVKAAIESAVLPIGSSSIKRETDFNIALNAFIGPFAGTEYLPKLKEKQWSGTIGVTAPVGIAFSWGKKGKGTGVRSNGKEIGGKSLTIFIPVIDIGAMAAFRLKEDSSNVAAEVKLKNIISPGLYFYYGFGKCPLSVGIGAQLGPQLREVTAKDVNVDKNIYVRFGVNLVVDIPFFNFFTKNDEP